MISDDDFNQVVNDGALADASLLRRVSHAYACLQAVINSGPEAEQAFADWCSRHQMRKAEVKAAEQQRQETSQRIAVEQPRHDPSDDKDDDWTAS